MIVLDFGSGNTCGNNPAYACRMIDELAAVIDRRGIIIKWQLFKSAPPNAPLDHWVYTVAHQYARELGFETTASVFDKSSLAFLLQFEPPFVKIANRRDLWKLVENVPPEVPLVQSFGGAADMYQFGNIVEFPLCCISRYPADIQQYEDAFEPSMLQRGISDHTIGFDLYRKYQPKVWEKHYVLERGGDNPDAGPFAVTPAELREVL